MKTYVITRHKGAVEWIEENGYKVDYVLQHCEVGRVSEGDIVIGVLPIHIAGELCKKKAKFLALCIDTPKEFRGKELTCAQLKLFGCRLVEYFVQELE